MLEKCLSEEESPSVDVRLVRVVRMIVEQYDGDVGAFVESIRGRERIDRGDEDEAESTNEPVLPRT
jgi:hypothetical protein